MAATVMIAVSHFLPALYIFLCSFSNEISSPLFDSFILTPLKESGSLISNRHNVAYQHAAFNRHPLRSITVINQLLTFFSAINKLPILPQRCRMLRQEETGPLHLAAIAIVVLEKTVGHHFGFSIVVNFDHHF
jgi:hypothetical protein